MPYPLDTLGVNKIHTDGTEDFPLWFDKVGDNLRAVQALVGDVEIFRWAGRDGVSVVGTPVCVSEPGSVAFPLEAAVTEAVDHVSGGSQWLRRPVGVLLDALPSLDDEVRVRLLGRSPAPVQTWTSEPTCGAKVYLRSGTLGDLPTFGRLTTDPAETNAQIVVGLYWLGDYIIVRPRVSIL